MSNEQPEINIKKFAYFGIYVLFVIAILAIGFKSYTITPAGQTKVQTCFGDVSPNPLREGLHIPVKPWCSYDTYDTRQFKYEIPNINIPTQDRFNSSGIVTALIRIAPESTPDIKKNYGTMEAFLDKTVRQYLMAQVRDEGRKLPDSRSLAISDKVSLMQENLKRRLTTALAGRIEVSEVLIQNIEFDPRIASQILKTQERIQKEQAEESQLRIATTVANQRIADSNGQAESQKLISSAEKQKLIDQADGKAYSAKQQAEARSYAVKQEADAKRYALEQQAIGNKKLTESLTPEILQLKELEVRMAEAGSGWNGQLPANYSPIYGSKNEASSAPFILKTIK